MPQRNLRSNVLDPVMHDFPTKLHIFLLDIAEGLHGWIQDFLRGGSEHRGVSLRQGAWGGIFCYYNTKIMLIVRYRAYLSKYKEVLAKYGVGVWWVQPLGGYRLFYYIKC